ncbi:septal ring lytic transglycosylase RlpA family protein [Salinisphaera aquimarina]|uniref:Endolytic peptidoglycan transglycosylase RlpA n=1 Tax=Salinisphaera aquimarina TaxID=2094031 RepID=A0ABV7EQD1_9GAMM
MRALRIYIGVGAAALLLAGCASGPSGGGAARSGSGGGYYQNDGPPDDENIDLDAIPDAVPRNEPLSRYGNPSSYEALGKTYYVLPSAAGFTQSGRASWYGRQFHGRRTSSGEPYNMFKMTAAHKRLPIPSYVRVTNLDNGKHVIVRVNDRGPFHDGRIIDLSYAAARRLDVVATGSAPVRIETVTPATLRAEDNQRNAQTVRASRSSTAPTSTGMANVAATEDRDTVPAARPASRPAPARPVPVANRGNAGSPDGDLYLQSGAFGSASNAQNMRARLGDAGFTRVVIVDPDTTTPLYRVRLGPFDSQRSRALTQQILSARGFAAREVDR